MSGWVNVCQVQEGKSTNLRYDNPTWTTCIRNLTDNYLAQSNMVARQCVHIHTVQ